MKIKIISLVVFALGYAPVIMAQKFESTTSAISKDWKQPPNYYEATPGGNHEVELVPAKAGSVNAADLPLTKKETPNRNQLLPVDLKTKKDEVVLPVQPLITAAGDVPVKQ